MVQYTYIPPSSLFLLPGTPGLGTTGVAIPKRSMCTRSTKNDMVDLHVTLQWTDLQLIKGLFIFDSWWMITSLWTHSYLYHVLVCTVNSHNNDVIVVLVKCIQTFNQKKAILLWKASHCFFAMSSVPIQVPLASKPTSIDFVPISRPEVGAKQLLSLNRTPNCRWQKGLHSSFWEFLLEFVWLTIYAKV